MDRSSAVSLHELPAETLAVKEKTMQTVRVTALQSFEHHGHRYRQGDAVEMLPLDAAAAARRRDVTLSRPAAVLTRDLRAATPEPEVNPTPKPLPVPPPPPVPEEPKEPTPKPPIQEPEKDPQRRQYRRRDLKAEK